MITSNYEIFSQNTENTMFTYRSLARELKSKLEKRNYRWKAQSETEHVTEYITALSRPKATP